MLFMFFLLTLDKLLCAWVMDCFALLAAAASTLVCEFHDKKIKNNKQQQTGVYHAYHVDTSTPSSNTTFLCCGGRTVPPGVSPKHQNIATAVVDAYRTDEQHVPLL